MRPPDFWRHGIVSPWPALLSPAARIVAGYTARRVGRPGWTAPVPVVCCGNATVGGAGKTTLVLDLARRLLSDGRRVHILIRGYGGSGAACRRVDPARDDAAETGDEALLLAAIAPCWVGADRAETARAAIAAGAEILIMDDGLQNPSLHKTLPILVIDGASGFGNGRVLPAGPLREPAEAAAARVRAAVLIGEDATGALARLPPALPVLRADLVPVPEIAALKGTRVLAFAGIARPDKFFSMLEGAGVGVAGRVAFADHHPFTARDVATLEQRAASLGAVLVTTPKDHVRLQGFSADIRVVGVSLRWADDAALNALLAAP